MACLRSPPMRDRARAMRPARYVGPAGKERFGAFVWFGLVRVGLRWVSGWDFGWDCARGIFPPERVLSRTPLIIRTVDRKTPRPWSHRHLDSDCCCSIGSIDWYDSSFKRLWLSRRRNKGRNFARGRAEVSVHGIGHNRHKYI